MKIVSIVNTKGGVGKTVTTVHLGGALAQRGQRVLLFDIDLQHGLSTYFRADVSGPTASQVLAGNASIHEAALELRPNLHIVPATSDMESVETELLGASGGEVRLRRAFRRFATETKSANTAQPDWVLIDCPSGWSTVTRNALLASHALLIPINSEPAAIHTALATQTAAQELADLHDHELALLGIALTRFRSTNIARAVAQTALTQWGESVFETRIRQAERVNELAASGETFSDLSASGGGGVAGDYATLAEEILARAEKLRF